VNYKVDLTWMTSHTFDTKHVQKFLSELQTSIFGITYTLPTSNPPPLDSNDGSPLLDRGVLPRSDLTCPTILFIEVFSFGLGW
jgi:hypothetical protein